MQTEELLGFKRLSDRYPMFPILLNSSKSIREITIRPWIWWGPLKWLKDQYTEALEKEPPDWWPIVSPYELTLIDGRKFKLSEAEKVQYLEHLVFHDGIMALAARVQITENAYKGLKW